MRRQGLVFPLLILVAINILNFYDRNVAGALAEPMRKEFHLSDSQIGLLGSLFVWLYATVGFRWVRSPTCGAGRNCWLTASSSGAC